MKNRAKYTKSRIDRIDQVQALREDHPHDILSSTMLNHHMAEQRNQSKSLSRFPLTKHYDSYSFSSSESSSPSFHQQPSRPRRSHDSTKKIMRGAELVKMQIISRSSDGSSNPSLLDVGSNHFVLKDLESSLNQMSLKEQTRDISPESPRDITQFDSEVKKQSNKKQQNKSRQFMLKSILKQGSSFTRSSRKNSMITYKPATLEAFPPTEIRESVPFRHAQKAGLLWQTIVGTFVKFPTVWFDGSRTPEMGISNKGDIVPKWNFLCLLRIQDRIMSSYIKDRRSSGKLMLHVIITDAEENEIRDIAIGCFHPKARGVYSNNRYIEQNLEDILTDDSFRDVWMAVRKRCGNNEKNIGSKSTWIERFLTSGQSIDIVGRESPISHHKKSINNDNVRSVFGHGAPKETILLSKANFKEFMQETETDMEGDDQASPTILLLKRFLYK